MSFLNNISRKASVSAAKTMNRARDFNDLNILQGGIRNLEAELGRTYQRLGEEYYKHNHDNPEPALQELVHTTSNLLGQIKKMEESMAAIRSRKQCSVCGNILEPDAMFCNHCGTPVSVSKSPQGRVCPFCGSSVEEDSRFCTSCGKPLPSAPQPQLQPQPQPQEQFQPQEQLQPQEQPQPQEQLQPQEQPQPHLAEPVQLGQIEPPEKPAEPRICPSCGNVLNPGALFCPRCGGRLEADSAAAGSDFNHPLPFEETDFLKEES